jgi:hypothetical protein
MNTSTDFEVLIVPSRRRPNEGLKLEAGLGLSLQLRVIDPTTLRLDDKVTMALALTIAFKDPKRKNVYHPFSFQVVLQRSWWPLAKRLGLPLLQQLECLEIKERQEAERLIGELEIVRETLQHPEDVSISPDDAAYMLRRISEVEPMIRGAVQEWSYVDYLSL